MSITFSYCFVSAFVLEADVELLVESEVVVEVVSLVVSEFVYNSSNFGTLE